MAEIMTQSRPTFSLAVKPASITRDAIDSRAALVARGAGRVSVLESQAVRWPALKKNEITVAVVDTYPGAPHLVVDAYGGAEIRTPANEPVRPGGTITHSGRSAARRHWIRGA